MLLLIRGGVGFLLACYLGLASLALSLSAQDIGQTIIDKEQQWTFKLDKKDIGETYLGYRVDYSYSTPSGREFDSLAILDHQGGEILKTSYWIPRHSNIQIVTPLMRSDPKLFARLDVFKRERNKIQADLPLSHGSFVSLGPTGFRAIGLKKSTGIGMFDLIIDEENFGLKLAKDGSMYEPFSFDEFLLLNDSLEVLLAEKYSASLLSIHAGELIGTKKHRRNGSLVFEERTMRHPQRGLHKHYVFYRSSKEKSAILKWSIQEDGEIAYLEKVSNENVLLTDNQSDGHYEWMIIGFDGHEELIDTTDPWHIKLASDQQFAGFLDLTKAGKEAISNVQEQYLKHKDELPSK